VRDRVVPEDQLEDDRLALGVAGAAVPGELERVDGRWVASPEPAGRCRAAVGSRTPIREELEGVNRQILISNINTREI
jgi:hypothetical protein